MTQVPRSRKRETRAAPALLGSRDVSQVGLQLGKVEARSESGFLGLRRQDRVRLVHALIPPGPCGLLRVSPRQHGQLFLVVTNRVDRVAVVGQRARRPGLVLVKLLLAVLLDVESQV